MTRDVLMKMLGRVDGVKLDGERFRVKEDHHLHFYLGRPGQAMIIREVASGALDPDFVEIVTRDSETRFFVDYSAVHAVATLPPKKDDHRRAGFA
jgi:hypothetical protein